MGEREFFAARWGVRDYAMCLTGGALTVALVTAHIPLRDVPARLSADEIVRTGRLLGVSRGVSINPVGLPTRRNPELGHGGPLPFSPPHAGEG